MAMLPKLKIKALVSFPANVFGGTGISIDKANGNFTIDLNYSEFAFQGTLPTGSNVLVWDPVSNVYTLIPPSATGGISDAPTDGKVYGRKLAAWVDAWDSPVLTGNPTSVTPAPGDNDTSIATTAFVAAALGGSSIPVPATAVPMIESGLGAVGTSLKYAREDHVHPAGGGGGGGASVLVSDTAPIGATVNSLWFESDTGILYIYYADGTSTQWVAIAAGGIDVGAVRFDSAQTLTSETAPFGTTVTQRAQARKNIYAAPFDAMAYNGMQINGGLDVSQENGNSSLSISTGTPKYIVDGWQILRAGTSVLTALQQAGSSAFFGFQNYLNVGVTTAQTSFGAGDLVQVYSSIEGYRCARLAWGIGAATPVTIAFWTAHHRTGIYSLSLGNGSRSYVTTYTQNVADIPQYNIITVPGDTLGTWAVTNVNGFSVVFCLGSGSTYIAPSTNAWLTGNYTSASGQVNAVASTSDVFRVTGVVVLPGIEAPSAARSPLIMRPYDQELMTCKRYWEQLYAHSTAYSTGGTGVVGIIFPFPVEKRATPTLNYLAGGSLNNCAFNSNTLTTKELKVYLNITTAGTYILSYQATIDARL